MPGTMLSSFTKGVTRPVPLGSHDNAGRISQVGSHEFPDERLPGSLAVHCSGMDVLRPSGDANAVAGCFSGVISHMPVSGQSASDTPRNIMSGSARLRLGLLQGSCSLGVQRQRRHGHC